MASILNDLKDLYRKGNLVIRLIYINTAVFVIYALTEIVFMLFNQDVSPIWEWAQLPASFARLAHQPWAILTYMFMHAGVMHLVLNMLWLYFFGKLFLFYFSSKHLRGVYLLGGICGGLLFMISFNLFPYFSGMVNSVYMVGASASVLAIVAATAYRDPNYTVRILFLGAIRLKYLALIAIGSDLLLITSNNAGGHIAHLGGAAAGLGFAAGLLKGFDLTKWINFPIDTLSNAINSIQRPVSKPKMKVHYNEKSKDYQYNAEKKAHHAEIDRILDKIKQSGYESLTSQEKKTLFDISQKS